MKKLFVLILSLSLIMAPISSICVFASDTQGTCGEKATWKLENGVLTISGSGAMEDYDHRIDKKAPWSEFYKSIKSIVVEQGITSIGDYSFSLFPYVESVTLPESLTKIGWKAFSSLNITSISLPAGLKEIGKEAFYRCEELADITIGDNLEAIGADAFKGTAYMMQSDETEVYLNNYLIYAKANGSFTVREGTILIADSVFESQGYLTDVTLPKSLKYIGNSAFRKCKSLNNVTLPDSLKTIGTNAFENCNTFTQIYIPDSVTCLGYGAFASCIKAKTLRITPNIERIDDATFASCGVVKLEIPEGVREIGEAAFSHCLSLEEVILPDSVTSLELNSFNGSYLKKLKIGKGLAEIESSAFRESPFITEIIVDEENPYMTAMDNNLYSKDKTSMLLYAKGKPDSTFIVPLSVTRLEHDVFAYNKSLKEIIMHDKITYIGENCMLHTELVKVSIPNSVTEIGIRAFSQCVRIEEIELGCGLKKIGSEAFSSDSSVKSVSYTGTQAQWEQIDIGNYNEGIGKGGYGFIKPKFEQAFSNPIVYVTLNGERIDFSKYGQNPIVENGRTLVPLRSVFEALGASVEWNDALQEVTSVRDGVEVKLRIDAYEITVNGSVKTLDAAPKLLNSRTMVPLRAVVEAFGCAIEWDGAANTAGITM